MNMLFMRNMLHLLVNVDDAEVDAECWWMIRRRGAQPIIMLAVH